MPGKKKKTQPKKPEHLLQSCEISGCREYSMHDASELQAFDKASQETLLTDLIHFSFDRNKIIQSKKQTEWQ